MIQILDYSENHICLWPIYNYIIKIDQSDLFTQLRFQFQAGDE